MLRGIYSAASGMSLQFNFVNTFANNLANAGTTGFKRSEVVGESFPELVVQMAGGNRSAMGMGVGPGMAQMDLKQGTLKPTENPMDLALQGEGFFQVLKANGTRDVYRGGHFILNAQREMTTTTGDRLLLENGQVARLNTDDVNLVRVNERGDLYEAGQLLGRIRVVKVTEDANILDPQMRKILATVSSTDNRDDRPEIRQGFLEDANVEVVTEMIGLLQSQKIYDMNQKLIQTEDKMLDKTINEMGRG